MTANPELRWPASRWVGPAGVLTATGWGCIVLGGLFAAVTGPLELVQGSWLAAYLVLVGGVAQVAMGAARTRYATDTRPSSWPYVQVVAWNAGNVAVISGTLSGRTLPVDLGSLLLVVAIVIALDAARPRDVPADHVGGQVPRLVLWAYRALLVVLAVSIPVGIVLSHVRHG